jgi:hypothetical protein
MTSPVSGRSSTPALPETTGDGDAVGDGAGASGSNADGTAFPGEVPARLSGDALPSHSGHGGWSAADVAEPQSEPGGESEASQAGADDADPAIPQLEFFFDAPVPEAQLFSAAHTDYHGTSAERLAPNPSTQTPASLGPTRSIDVGLIGPTEDNRIRLANRPRSRRLPRRTPSQLEGGSHVDVRYLLRLDTRAAMRRGSIMHAWLEQIAWLDDGVPGDSELHRIARRIDPGLDSQDIAPILSEFRRSISHPAVRTALSRAAYAPSAIASREVRFLHREGETIVEGSIDRLILVRGSHDIESAEVIDFKTDLQTSSSAVLADRVSYYRPQLAAYCRAVGAMHRLRPGTVSGKLIFLESGKVVPVERLGATGP